MTDPASSKHRSSCPIARSLDLLGDKWTLIIMRDALYFDSRTFADFSRSRERIPTNLLADRLKRLVEMELLEKVPYHANPTRYEYVPTEKGESIKPVLTSLRVFGETHLGGEVARKN